MRLAVLVIAGFLAASTLATPLIESDDDTMNSVKDLTGALSEFLTEALAATSKLRNKQSDKDFSGSSQCDTVHTVCNNLMRIDWTKHEKELQTLMSNETMAKLTNKATQKILELVTGGFDNFLLQQ